MEIPFNMIEELWKTIRSGNKDEIRNLFSEQPTLVIGNERYYQDRIVEELLKFECDIFTLDQLQVITYNESVLQVIYNTEISIRKRTNAAKAYFVSCTWEKVEDNYLISCMIINKAD